MATLNLIFQCLSYVLCHFDFELFLVLRHAITLTLLPTLHHYYYFTTTTSSHTWCLKFSWSPSCSPTIHPYTYICIFVCTYIRMYVHKNIQKYVCMYIHTCYVLTNPPIPSSRCKYFVVLRPV
jgi:hypothetical protein